jgi:gamma-glutamylcyclotransferase (GGCT)/AIG2-like uncharacterized protein YtfP
MLVFLYGTLTDPRVFAAAAGTAAPLARARPARLTGYRRVTLRGTPYPTLVRDPDATVEGLLAAIPPALLPALHAYEGRRYRFLPVRVVAGVATVEARAWIAPEGLADRHRPWSPSAVGTITTA